MSQDRLNRNDKIVLVIWIVAGIIGAAVAHTYFFRAFPEASVEFKVPRAAALEQARQFASAQGAPLAGYESSVIFDVDETAKTYLEREIGLQQANQMMSDQIHIWYWQARFFRPLQKEEFDVRVGPAGGVAGYTHVLEETAPGARLDRAAAQAIAEAFLRDAVHADLSHYDFQEQEANLTERPNRRDWNFSWERAGFRAKDAPYKLNVSLAGGSVAGYEEILKVPEAWKLEYERLRSTNNLIEYMALIPYAFLLGGCLYVIFSLGRRGLLEPRASLIFGAFLTALFFAMTMNQWPLERAGYDTNTPYSSFFLGQVGQAMLLSVVSALLAVLALAPGEPLYRVAQPANLQLNAGMRLPGIRSKEFFIANVIGICMAAAHIGYITVFYILGRNLGVWAPQDLSYTNVVSTALPWVYPLAIGIYAATSEEFLFRLFAIPFLLRTTKSKFLAVVLPAFAWGFLHSNYPQQPAYIRGIEVGLIGIVAGLVMLRWGIWATLIWHYTVDAFLISTSLLRSQDAYLRISGAIVGGAALVPLAIAGISYLRRGGFETDARLLNAARPLEPAETMGGGAAAPAQEASGQATTPAQYVPMPSRWLVILIAAAALGIASFAGAKREAIGDFVRFPINAREATARADDALRGAHVDPASYRHATTVTYTFDGYTNEYLRRAVGISGANRIYRDQAPAAFWATRYFRDSQNEEYMVILRPDGSLHSIHHTLNEKAPGANLSKDEALRLAENYLRDTKHVDLSAWNLVETNSDRKPARTDHLLEWEQRAALDAPATGQAGAHLRMQMHVQGDEVSGYRVYVKIPQAWRDAESRTTPLQMAQGFGKAAGFGLVLVTVLVLFFRSLKHPEIAQVPWRSLGKWCSWMLLAAIVLFVNRAPQLMASYTTAWPLKTFYAVLGISLLFLASLYLAAAVLLLGLAWYLVERAFGDGRLGASARVSWFHMPREYYRDALAIAILGTAAVMGLQHLPAVLNHWPVARHALGAAVPGGLDVLSPAAGAIAAAVSLSVIIVGVFGVIGGLIATYVRPLWMRVALVALLAVLTASDIGSPGAFLREVILVIFSMTVLWLGITRLARFNLLGYFLVATMVALISGAVELIEQPNAYFRANGYAVLSFAAALVLGLLILWRRAQPTSVAAAR